MKTYIKKKIRKCYESEFLAVYHFNNKVSKEEILNFGHRKENKTVFSNKFKISYFA